MSENVINSNQKYARDIGFDYGHSDNNVQAELLNGFAKGVRTACIRDSTIETQFAYVVQGLDVDARKVLMSLAGMIEVSTD